jgi:acyl-CoA thioester hydrolase
MPLPVNRLAIRIYYEDTDSGNVVYYANYLRYMERGRAELMRELGFPQSRLHKEDAIFVVAEVNCKYHKPARYNDLLTVETAITGHTAHSLSFHYEIVNQNGERCVSADIKAACVDNRGKLRKIPAAMLEVLEQR